MNNKNNRCWCVWRVIACYLDQLLIAEESAHRKTSSRGSHNSDNVWDKTICARYKATLSCFVIHSCLIHGDSTCAKSFFISVLVSIPVLIFCHCHLMFAWSLIPSLHGLKKLVVLVLYTEHVQYFTLVDTHSWLVRMRINAKTSCVFHIEKPMDDFD